MICSSASGQRVVVFCAAILLLLQVTGARGAPVFGEVCPVEQPDGSRVEVRIWGDEFYGVTESLDGYTLVRDPHTQFLCYARLSDNGDSLVSTGVRVNQARPEDLGIKPHIRISPVAAAAQTRAARARFEREGRAVLGGRPAGRSPTTGQVVGICLIVEFPDVPGTIPRDDVVDFCNQEGYAGYGNNGSVRDYYYDISDGLLTYTNDVTSTYYTALNDKSYYTDPAVPYGERAVELILEALNDLESGGFDFSPYDADGDGVIDALNCFYAGYNVNQWGEGLWPHAWNVSFCADDLCTERYQITPMSTSLSLGTFCHENGHMLCGWPDLYDYDYDSAGAGAFCIMAHSLSQTNPPEPCAYLRYTAGWSTTTLLETPQANLTVPAGVNTFFKYDHPTNTNEFYILENRQQSGRDTSLPDAGLAIWHVDTEGSNDNQQMTPESHYLVTLVQADDRWDLERNQNSGDDEDLWSAPTAPRCAWETNPSTDWWDGSVSGLAVYDISNIGPTMTFSFGWEPDCNENGILDFEDVISGAGQDCDDDGILDECEIAAGTSLDENENGVPDECEACELIKLIADVPGWEYYFGSSVAVENKVAVVGAPSDGAAAFRAGAAYVFRRGSDPPGDWVQEAKLLPDDGDTEDYFGNSVSISGDRIVVGAPGKDDFGGWSGAAYVFRYNPGLPRSWVQEAKLLASDGEANDNFGDTVAIDDERIVIGASTDSDGGTYNGSAYVFEYLSDKPGEWVQVEKLWVAGASRFGSAIAIENDVIVVGAWNTGDRGTAYVFRGGGSSWTEEAMLRASDRDLYDRFGRSVAVSENRIIVGSPLDDDPPGHGLYYESGSAYVFRYDPAEPDLWVEEDKLLASDGGQYHFFGSSVAIEDDVAVIGAKADWYSSRKGRTYIFRRHESNWVQEFRLRACDEAPGDVFGNAVAMSDGTVVIGASKDHHSGLADAGSVYVFGGLSDCNGNGRVDLRDLIDGASSDCNWNGRPDECDVLGRGAGFDDVVSWAAFDPSANGVGHDPRGYTDAAFDGRYLYFSPHARGGIYHGEVLRFDTQAGFHEASSWAAFDAGVNGVGTNPVGYVGAVFDGRYVYFAPDHDEVGRHGEVLRYDTVGPFDDPVSWSTYDYGDECVAAETCVDPDGYRGAVFDRRHVYFVPYHNGTRFHAEVLRLDTTGGFADAASWEAYVSPFTTSGGYWGAVVADGFIYFAPTMSLDLYHSEVLRYKGGNFSSPISWDTYDPSAHGVGDEPGGYVGAAFDGKYVYFAQHKYEGTERGEMLRYTTGTSFDRPDNWLAYDPGDHGVGTDPGGYAGAVFDGRFVYFVPGRFLDPHGEVLRYDTEGPFESASAWTAYDAGTAGIGVDPDGFCGAVFDGRYVYFVPFQNRVGLLGGNGEVLRYDARSGGSFDCNGNDIPDECDIDSGVSADCNGNGVPDECEIERGVAADCNANGYLDGCDLAGGTSEDCNLNGKPDDCDINDRVSPDCNTNGVPDECDVAGVTSQDCQPNGIPDECDLDPPAEPVFFDDFPSWTLNSERWPVTEQAFCTESAYFSPPHSLLINEQEYVESAGIDLSSDVSAQVKYYWRNRDTQAGDDLEVDYWDGQAWHTLTAHLGGTSVPEWQQFADDVAETAMGAEFRIRFRGSIESDDARWYIDDVEISAIPPPTSSDCNDNSVPDECELDCNANGLADDCEPIGGGDFDADADVDLDDHPSLVECLAGPGEAPAPLFPECVEACLNAFDFDLDADVDLRDFAGFQDAFGGQP